MPRRTHVWNPKPESLAPMPSISGNAVNGLGETELRRPSPFFWHEPHFQTHGEMQAYTLGIMFRSPDSGPIVEAFQVDLENGGFRQRGPAAIPVASKKIEKPAATWSDAVKAFALENEADLVGVTDVDPLWVFEGFEIDLPRLVVIGVAHDYDQISKAPSPPGDNRGIVEVGKQYTRAARSANKLRNFIRSQGYQADSYEGPTAGALAMIPAAIAAGLGELGKHGSIINRKYGSSFRLSAVATDMPLVADRPDTFGADEFCMACQVCTEACPPAAIWDHKQTVRGVERWYVDFDKCIPYFAEARGCAICIAVCPWSRPGVADNLVVKMAKRRQQTAAR